MTDASAPGSAAVSDRDPRLVLGELGPKLMRVALAVGAGGLFVSLLQWMFLPGVDAARFFRAYLVAFVFVLSLGLGGLFFTFLQHLAKAGWSVTVRRLAEALAGSLTYIWILFLPVLVLVLIGQGGVLYDWLDPATVAQDAVIAGKSGYLNRGFWLIRAVVFLGLWAVLGRFFFRTSVAQDASGDVSLTHRMQTWAPVAGLVYAFSQTFAIVDWVMTLEAHWFSTMFGVYFFAASCCGFFSIMILFMYGLQRSGRLENEITLEHYQDVGKLLFGFGVVFWAYIAFSQYMLIWYANMPEETAWYLVRQLGGWKAVSAILLVGHFAIPFVLLVSKHTKRIKPVIALIAGWLLLMHYVDMYWLVMPVVPAHEMAAATTIVGLEATLVRDGIDLGYHPHLVDLTCLLGVAGLFMASVVHRLRACALIPLHDPRLSEALSFENV